jgi:hypothetical protein
MLITDMLTGKEYRVIGVDPTDTKNINRFAEKVLLSMNEKHRRDYFWGELSASTRKVLRDQEIFNLDDLRTKADRLSICTNASLVEIVKFVTSLKK